MIISPRPLHVLTITPFFPRAANESNGCFVAEPISELLKLGLRSTVFAVEPFYRKRVRPLGANPAKWFRYPSFPGGMGLSSGGTGLFARLRGPFADLHREFEVDLIHAHSALPCGLAAQHLGRRFSVPYAVTVHGLDAFSSVQVQGWFGERCRAVSRKVFEDARRVIAISWHVQEEIQRGAPASRISVVYNGGDPELFSPGVDPQTPRLLTVGNLIATKGHEWVMRALSELQVEFPGLTWEVIGDGPERNRLVELSRDLGLARVIQFRGRQDRQEVSQAFKRCTIFVLPSRYEGLGCVYLEAMLSEKAAIGCRGQGIEEVIRHGENGWLVSTEQHGELVEGVRILLRDDKLRKQIATSGRETVLRSFTVHRQALRLEAVYRECVA